MHGPSGPWVLRLRRISVLKTPALLHTRFRAHARAVLIAATAWSASSANVVISRNTVGSDAIAPNTPGCARSTATSGAASPPSAAATARSATIFPGSWPANGHATCIRLLEFEYNSKVELSRRYSNHVNQTNTLVKALELVRTRPAPGTGAPVRPTSGRTSHPSTGRAKVDAPAVVASYLSRSRLIDLAEEHGVSPGICQGG